MPAAKSHETSKAEASSATATATAIDEAAHRSVFNHVWHRVATHVSGPPGGGAGGDPPPVQAKLSVSRPNDPHEREADRVADQVMLRPWPDAPGGPAITWRGRTPAILRVCAECEEELQRQVMEEEEDTVQAKGVAGGSPAVPPATESRIDSLLGDGRPLPQSARDHFESRFGYDFSKVRVHTGREAADSARELNARAFTIGRDVVFGAGQYAPDTSEGQRLLAHELTHTAQQGQASPARGPALASQSGAHVSDISSARGSIQREEASTILEGLTATTAERIGNELQLLSNFDLTNLEKALLARRYFPLSGQRAQLESLLLAHVRGELDRRFIERMTDTQLAASKETAELYAARGVSAEERERIDQYVAVIAAEQTARLEAPADYAGSATALARSHTIGTLGLVSHDEGVWLHKTPETTAKRMGHLELNKRVFVDREFPGGWYFVTLDTGDYGYAEKALITTSLPDPEARLYRIQAGDTAQRIVQVHFRNFVWGKDERYYVNVLVFVNDEQDRNGIRKQDAQGNPLPIDADWETTFVEAGKQIWIPGEAYADSLRGQVSSGSFTYEAWKAVKSAAAAVGEFLIGTGAFIGGLLVGALNSIWDLLVGIVDLIGLIFKLIWSIITLELVNDVKAFWNQISQLTVSDIFDAVSTWLDQNWNNPSTAKRWYFRGWLIGYIIMEIVMLFLSGGLLTAVKWAGKSAWVAKLLAKFPQLAKIAKAAKALETAEPIVKLRQRLSAAGAATSAALAAAQKWVIEVLRVPIHIAKWLTLEGIELLKRLPEWAVERFTHLSATAMRVLLGCASKCKVNLDEIVAYLSKLTGKATGAPLRSAKEIIAALPEGFNVQKIERYLRDKPALMTAIKEAELSADDFGKLADFMTEIDKLDPEAAYETFVRYLTYVVPAKTNDIGKFNKIVEKMLEAESHRARAMKGPMFEAFARLHVFAGKVWRRIEFTASKTLPLKKSRRTADFFDEATGELWDMKHAFKPDLDQADDYKLILGHTEAGMPAVTSINYLFPSLAAATTKENLKLLTYGHRVWYLDDAGKLVRYIPKPTP